MEGSLEEKVGVGVASDLLITLGMHNLLDLMVDEVVEGINVHHAGAMKRLEWTKFQVEAVHIHVTSQRSLFPPLPSGSLASVLVGILGRPLTGYSP